MDYELHDFEERIDLLGDQTDSRSGGVSAAVIVSFVLHALIFAYFIATYKPLSKDAPAPPIARYVELIRQNPDKSFVESPGPKLEHAPSPNAAFSDGNRKASTPNPTGEQPTSTAAQTNDELSSRFSWSTTVAAHHFAELNSAVLSMAEASDGKLWLATEDKGLFYMRDGRVSAVLGEGKLDRKISCFLALENGELWIGTEKGAGSPLRQ